MSTKANGTDDSGQLGFASFVWIGLIVSWTANFVQGVNAVRATCPNSESAPRVVNQNICNFYYVESRDLKTLADIRAIDESDLSGDIKTEETISN